MVAYSLFFLLIMLIIGGIGVDFMHYEMSRTRLQNTLDRAVLAAADLQQTLDPVAVVQDYLNKADVGATLHGVPTVNSGLNYRDVTANAQMAVPTQFIHMLGFSSLIAPAHAQAEEKIEAVEISLVLDISGSMNSNNRLINLKPAAKEFIDAVMALTETGGVTVSIIPYNTQVNAGATLLSYYNVSDEHTFSNCVNFDTPDFSTPALSAAQALKRTMHFDHFTYYEARTPGYWDRAANNWPPQSDATAQPTLPMQGWELPIPVCPTWDGTEITVMSPDATALKNKIDALVANGNTSIDVGMKWAMTLLDPGTRDVITDMIADGHVSPLNAGKPLAYDTLDALKVIVVMTDGQNTPQFMLPEAQRTGTSDVYYYAGSTPGVYSIRAGTGTNKFFYPHNGNWANKPYGFPGTFVDDDNDGYDDNGTLSLVTRLSYADLYAQVSQAYNARYIYGPLMGTSAAWSQWYTNAVNSVSGSDKDARLQSICSTARHEGVVIYAIGFEATANGNTQLRNCASSPAHFYPATGTNITDVFQAIAASITQLRLTQ